MRTRPRDAVVRPRPLAGAASGGPIAITGDGLPAQWTVRAVERAGYEATTDPSAAVRIEVIEEDRRIGWRLVGPSRQAHFASLGALVTELREAG